MNVREMRQLIHDQPDDMELEFGMDGEVYAIGGNIVVKEWNTIYFGVDKEDLTESLIEYEMSNSGEDEDLPPADDDEWPEDREAFMESLARAEDAVPTETKGTDVLGDCCQIPSKPVEKEIIADTELM